MLKYPLISKQKLAALEVGDRVTRILGSAVIKGLITSRGDNVLGFSPLESREEFNKITMEGAKRVKEMIGFDAVDTIASNDDIPEWTFNATTGLEIDESLHWDGINRTGSYLTTVV
jgi:hypothetical protein